MKYHAEPFIDSDVFIRDEKPLSTFLAVFGNLIRLVASTNLVAWRSVLQKTTTKVSFNKQEVLP